MATIKFKGKPEIYLNSLVKSPEKYFSEQTKPIEAEIMEASFERNGEEEFIIEGLWNYYINHYNNRNNSLSGALSISEYDFIHQKYSNIVLHLRVREKQSRQYANVKLENLDEIMAHLMENGKEELNELDNPSAKMSKEEKETEKERIYKRRDSCIPLMNRPLNIYRQAINGQDVIGFSKAYPAIKANVFTESAKTK
jgi:hypothetical protein